MDDIMKKEYEKFSNHIVDYCTFNGISAGSAYRFMSTMLTLMDEDHKKEKVTPSEDSPECGA